VEAPTVDGSCADLLLVAKSAGHTKVSIGYEHELFDLRATVVVAAYRHLKASLMLITLIAVKVTMFILCSEKLTPDY